MPIDDPSLHSSELEKNYQILTELHRTETSRTYLARHLELSRDVTITIVETRDAATAARVAADAQRLSSIRHANVVPVIEGRALSDGTFAVVHARVRGSTLDQTLSAVGPMPLPRVASTLQQVCDALEWARKNGIAHRGVSADALVFQQGSGRALVALDTFARDMQAASEICDDARTIGSLAWQMLAGRRDDASTPLTALRTDLPATISDRVEALRHCAQSEPAPDISGLIAAISAEAPENVAPEFPQTAIIDRGPAVARETGPAVVAVNQPFGFGARMVAAVAVVVIIGVLGVLLMRHRGTEVQSVARNVATDSNEMGGEVDTEPRRVDSTRFVTPPVSAPITPRIVPPPNMAAPAAQPMATSPSAIDTTRFVPRSPVTAPTQTPPVTQPSAITPPNVQRHEPPTTQPRYTLPGQDSARDSTMRRDSVVRDSLIRDSATRSVLPRDTAVSTATTDVCSAPLDASQRACLASAIQRGDAEMNGVYQRLIVALRRQAAVADSAADPVTVMQLRASQREWLDRRDQTCRSVGQPPLYARDRAQCFTGQTSQRVRDLQGQLAAIP